MNRQIDRQRALIHCESRLSLAGFRWFALVSADFHNLWTPKRPVKCRCVFLPLSGSKMLPKMEQFLIPKKTKTKRQHKTCEIVILCALPIKYQCFEWPTGANNDSKCEQKCTHKNTPALRTFLYQFWLQFYPKFGPLIQQNGTLGAAGPSLNVPVPPF